MLSQIQHDRSLDERRYIKAWQRQWRVKHPDWMHFLLLDKGPEGFKQLQREKIVAMKVDNFTMALFLMFCQTGKYDIIETLEMLKNISEQCLNVLAWIIEITANKYKRNDFTILQEEYDVNQPALSFVSDGNFCHTDECTESWEDWKEFPSYDQSFDENSPHAAAYKNIRQTFHVLQQATKNIRGLNETFDMKQGDNQLNVTFDRSVRDANLNVTRDLSRSELSNIHKQYQSENLSEIDALFNYYNEKDPLLLQNSNLNFTRNVSNQTAGLSGLKDLFNSQKDINLNVTKDKSANFSGLVALFDFSQEKDPSIRETILNATFDRSESQNLNLTETRQSFGTKKSFDQLQTAPTPKVNVRRNIERFDEISRLANEAAASIRATLGFLKEFKEKYKLDDKSPFDLR